MHRGGYSSPSGRHVRMGPGGPRKRVTMEPLANSPYNIESRDRGGGGRGFERVVAGGALPPFWQSSRVSS